MNICYVHTADFAEHKGSSIHVKELIRHLSRLHHIVLLVNRWDGSTLEGVHVVEMNCFKLWRVVWRALFSVLYVTRILISENIDLFYAKSPLEGCVTTLLGKLFGIPSIYEVNGLIAEEYKMKGEGTIHVFISSLLEDIAVNHAEHLICVTQWIKENLLLRGVPESKLTVVENGADADVFTFIENAKKILNLDPEKHYVGYIGTLKAWQGLDYMLSAVPLVQEKVPETVVLIVGEGELMEWLLQSIREKGLQNVVVTGEVEHEMVPLYISACDVCLVLKKPLSSGYSPLKLYEYMACERPVVASRVEGFECLEEEKAGILVDQEDPVEVADAVVTLLKDEELREDMGKRGREFVLKSHTWEKVAQKISDICQKTAIDQ